MGRPSLGRIYHRAFRCRRKACRCWNGGAKHLAKTYSIEYYRPGDPAKGEAPAVQVREATWSTEADVALRLLRERQGQLGKLLPVGPRAERLTFDDLCGLIRADYIDRRRRSIGRLEEHLRNLAGDRFRRPPEGAPRRKGTWESRVGYGFAGQLARSITAERVKAYKADRRTAGASEGSIALELSALKRMFKLARDNGDLLTDHIPAIAIPELDNAREVYIAPFQMEQLLGLVLERERDAGGTGWQADPQVARIMEVTYITGWRADSDVLTRQWPHVQWDKGHVFVETAVQKQIDGRRHLKRWPLIPRLREIFRAQREWTDSEEQRLGVEIPWVFHRRGRPIGGYRKTWEWACAELMKQHPEWGAEEWVRHAMRYSAVENLIAEGVSPTDICNMLGMTLKTFERYHRQTDAQVARIGMRLSGYGVRARRRDVETV